MANAGSAASTFSNTGPQGHRARMRARVLAAGAQSLADYEVLEMLLFFGIPRRDTKPLAKALINEFGSLFAVLRAPTRALRAASLSDDAIRALRLVPVMAERLAGAEARARPPLGNWDQLLGYLDLALQGAVPGQFRVLFLDNRNMLLADEAIAEADRDDMTRAIFRRALALHATALIAIQPSDGTDLSDQADVRADLVSKMALRSGALSITVHDVMIVGPGNWLSLRQEGRL